MKIVVVEVPMGEVEGGYVARFVGARLSGVQARGLKRLEAALRAQGAELLPKPGSVRGRRVETGADAVRWLLENYEQRLTVDN